MCYHGDARPPLAPVRAGVAAAGDMVMRSTDGSYFSAHFAHPDIPSATGVVILPDVRGLHDFYRDLAHRFAEAGHHAVAIDYFGRTAGTTARADDFAFRDHVARMEPANVDRDVAAGVAWLGETASAIITIGFCLGGALSWRQSATNPRPGGMHRLLRQARPRSRRDTGDDGTAPRPRRRPGQHAGRRGRGLR
jgi:carboxymethylenebutenolidase